MHLWEPNFNHIIETLMFRKIISCVCHREKINLLLGEKNNLRYRKKNRYFKLLLCDAYVSFLLIIILMEPRNKDFLRGNHFLEY